MGSTNVGNQGVQLGPSVAESQVKVGGVDPDLSESDQPACALARGKICYCKEIGLG